MLSSTLTHNPSVSVSEPLVCPKRLEAVCRDMVASGIERVRRKIDDDLFAHIKPFLILGTNKK